MVDPSGSPTPYDFTHITSTSATAGMEVMTTRWLGVARHVGRSRSGWGSGALRRNAHRIHGRHSGHGVPSKHRVCWLGTAAVADAAGASSNSSTGSTGGLTDSVA
ncbi:hypothetical protein PC129_g19076 [Phytophthora cactorum]|uniref:Uncharacterized protein n=1 Tax=Phytophthora cactorum TaxID=29920 RepID=A0A329RWF2_9STRA|nr:hypothetical protein Pcac1_g17223 [Phytophthora cactorum]KAG2801116.1 hypothetical protein PC112_g20179 [Phytophthora cactorum]KAG2814670.1 hypothetical protein PC111_g13888 [Phytophthora cactorum]KAG2836375.1 hypothetical protein PC113_g20040 [Phytophthora cactorum]KAG2880333.1 hypothetical protein PC114_g22120 [Phytophthora cactorum]